MEADFKVSFFFFKHTPVLSFSRKYKKLIFLTLADKEKTPDLPGRQGHLPSD